MHRVVMEAYTQNNRAFQKVTPRTAGAPYAWHPVNGSQIAVIADPEPLSSALPNALQVNVSQDASGQIGVGNEGYRGINVNSSWTYNASFFYRFPGSPPSNDTAANISLVSASGDIFATETAQLSTTSNWTQVLLTLKPSRPANNTSNNFTVTVDGAALAGKSTNFALFSLFPPTFKGQQNGMRADLSEALLDPTPSFFRWPGGNNLEASSEFNFSLILTSVSLLQGVTLSSRWQWNATIGPLTGRPGRLGDWGYINTDGPGMLEYLTWIESMGMHNIMAVWAGFDFNGSVAEADLAPYIEQAREQIEFAIGNTSTAGGALRASLGRQDPFVVEYVEIGNEDFFAAETYQAYRWRDFYGNLSSQFPDIRFLATTRPWNPVLSPTPPSYDAHVHDVPRRIRCQPIYHHPSNVTNGQFFFPNMEASTNEAASMTGLERNSDIVFTASYAPLMVVGHTLYPNAASVIGTPFRSIELGHKLFSPNLLVFDADSVIRPTSYYMQQLFSLNRGNEYLPSTLPTRNGSLFWSVTRRNSSAAFIIKIANTIETPAPMSFSLPSQAQSPGTAQVLSGSRNSTNSPDVPNNVVPKTSNITIGQQFNYTAPGFSVNVLTVPIA
ncbi:glycoside hydrolase family 51 protein [Gloeopeniophorella convolvens]|nr:glycoside hydrolase family 51 protein [Gloeopeniophorella convolvens]